MDWVNADLATRAIARRTSPRRLCATKLFFLLLLTTAYYLLLTTKPLCLALAAARHTKVFALFTIVLSAMPAGLWLDPPPPAAYEPECFNAVDASDYSGNLSTTRSGYSCQKWTLTYPHNHRVVGPIRKLGAPSPFHMHTATLCRHTALPHGHARVAAWALHGHVIVPVALPYCRPQLLSESQGERTGPNSVVLHD